MLRKRLDDRHLPTKVMHIKATGDSVFYTCLLSYLQSHQLQPLKIEHLRSSVYLVQCKEHSFIMKGFASIVALNKQKELTQLLKKNGFTDSYSFLEHLPVFEHAGQVFGAIEYVSPSSDRFHFRNEKNRIEGLRLLRTFHKSTGSNLTNKLSYFNQIVKWEERLGLFCYNEPFLRELVAEPILTSWINWAKWALAGMKQHENELTAEKSVIIHGDCAHHNFLRKQDGELALIDFDLIAYGAPLIDYLQYCSRIWPYLGDPAKELWSYPEIAVYKENKAFLYALTYPTDILREWNRLCKHRVSNHSTQMHSIWKMTVERFAERMKFNEEIAGMIELL
ncbi:phosphotransferase [Peribacillus huizhouensis]|uniref:Aminoglycoside phosphotransferase domain-containing protein n=1 Tax=Peribacillus huizhouensis TaxID=1501239 RepID=A0ABR6CM23_9BACI|nr:phosphotransferase [Peribacillus huizhouensis]MBA9025708.1 hypothetical protein [Peribacillus huizhouensis]